MIINRNLVRNSTASKKLAAQNITSLFAIIQLL